MIYLRVKCSGSLYPGFVADLKQKMTSCKLCVKCGYDKILSHEQRGTVLFVVPCLHSVVGQRLYDRYNKRKTYVWQLTHDITVELIPLLLCDNVDDIDDILRDVECSRRFFEYETQTTVR